MKIVICDDVKDELKEIRKLCETWCLEEDEILCFSSSKELCTLLVKEHPSVDLFILDIEMPEVTGLELKRTITERYADTNIVFLTVHGEIMQQAFGKHVLGFLQKDDDMEKLRELIQEVRDYKQKTELIRISDGAEERVFQKDQIIMIQAQHIYSVVRIAYYENTDRVQCKWREETYRISLKKWEEALQDDAFFRVGRNVIIHFAFVKRIEKGIVLDWDEEISVPVKRLKELKLAYNRYCAKVARKMW